MTATRPPAREHRTSVNRPADFDQFWEETLAATRAIPLDPTFERIAHRSTPTVEVHEIHYTSYAGLRIAGWYCHPNPERIPPPWPGLLIVPGYISEPTLPKGWAELGYAVIGVAPRGKLRSNATFNPGYPGLLVRDITDPQTYGYRGFYMDPVRALDLLREIPEVDSSRIGLHGSSQGGALTLTTAGLVPDLVACGSAGAPYLVGYMDAASLTHSYPYEEMNEVLRLRPDLEPAMRRSLDYYDGINFAPRITCPLQVYVGLGDDVCPPETGFDLQRALTSCDLEFYEYPRCAHDAGNYWQDAKVREFLGRHLRPASVEGAR